MENIWLNIGKKKVITDNGNIIEDKKGTKIILRIMPNKFISKKLLIVIGKETIKAIKETINNLYILFSFLVINLLNNIK